MHARRDVATSNPYSPQERTRIGNDASLSHAPTIHSSTAQWSNFTVELRRTPCRKRRASNLSSLLSVFGLLVLKSTPFYALSDGTLAHPEPVRGLAQCEPLLLPPFAPPSVSSSSDYPTLLGRPSQAVGEGFRASRSLSKVDLRVVLDKGRVSLQLLHLDACPYEHEVSPVPNERHLDVEAATKPCPYSTSFPLIVGLGSILLCSTRGCVGSGNVGSGYEARGWRRRQT